MASLRRTRCLPFSVEDACRVGEAAPERLLPLDSLFSSSPALTLNGRQERRCRCGNAFPMDGSDGTYRFYGPDGSFLAYGQVKDGVASNIKSFFEV